jgi:hypothetical protein
MVASSVCFFRAYVGGMHQLEPSSAQHPHTTNGGTFIQEEKSEIARRLRISVFGEVMRSVFSTYAGGMYHLEPSSAQHPHATNGGTFVQEEKSEIARWLRRQCVVSVRMWVECIN